MQHSVELARKSMQVDQRAWIVTTMPPFIGWRIGEPMATTVHIRNTGKTPARNLEGCIVSVALRNEDSLNFPCTGANNNAIVRVWTGMVAPNDPQDQSIPIVSPDTTGPLSQRSAFTQELNDELIARQLNIFVFGRFTYDDIFHVQHWLTFCRFIPSGPSDPSGQQPYPRDDRAKACVEYNNVDSN
jgi:hypothetical protein